MFRTFCCQIIALAFGNLIDTVTNLDLTLHTSEIDAYPGAGLNYYRPGDMFFL